jgi:IclR family transcriptional regulator, pca regulon regulatory protein
MVPKDKQRSYFSDSLARGLLVLRAFNGASPRLRVSEVAERTKLSRAVARRFLLTLRDLGYVGKDGEAFFLRPRVLDFGHQYFSSTNIWSLIQPLLVELAERTQEATTFGVLDDKEVLVVARAAKRMWDLAIGSGRKLASLPAPLWRLFFRPRLVAYWRLIFPMLNFWLCFPR